MNNWLGNLLSRIFRDLVAQFRSNVNRSRQNRSTGRCITRTSSNTGQHPSDSRHTGGSGRREYPGDFEETLRITYSSAPGEEANLGKMVWTWVSYEEDHRDGRNRSVLTISRDHEWLLGLLLTSKNHNRDTAQEARCGRLWMDIGTGEWGPQRHPSEVRINRILHADPGGIRRIGAVLDHEVFRTVAAAARARTPPNRTVTKVREFARDLSD